MHKQELKTHINGEVAEQRGCQCSGAREQLWVRCLAQGHPGSAKEANWQLSGYQHNLFWSNRNLNRLPLSKAKYIQNEILLPDPPQFWVLLSKNTFCNRIKKSIPFRLCWMPFLYQPNDIPITLIVNSSTVGVLFKGLCQKCVFLKDITSEI